MSSDVELPPELHDLIFDKLSDDTESTRTALRACLFASKSFWKRARRRLFSEVRIDDVGKLHRPGVPGRRRTHEEIDNRLKLLIELMRPPVPATISGSDQARLEYSLSQGIIPYVRHVHFGCCLDGLYTGINDRGAPLHPESATYCINILWMLCNKATSTLQTMEIDGTGPHDDAEWSGLLPHVRSALRHLCRAALLDMTLRYMTKVPSTILRGARNKNITFEAVTLFQPEPEHRVNFQAFPEYDEESMEAYSLPDLLSAYTEDLFDAFCDQMYPVYDEIPHHKMKTFQLSIFELEAIGEALDQVSREYPSLETLTLTLIIDEKDEEINQFDIQNMGNLKKFTIDLSWSLPSFISPVPYMVSILNFCSNSALSTIRLFLSGWVVKIRPDGSIDLDLNDVSDLDRCLSDASNFPALQCVVFHIQLDLELPPGVEASWEDKVAILIPFFQRCFPCLDLVKSRVKLILEFEKP